jgi:hypothetical protein
MGGANGTRFALLGLIALAVAAAVASMVRYPGMLKANIETSIYLAILAIGLALAVAAATLGTRTGSPIWRGAMRDGFRWGLLFGALWIVEMTVANLAYDFGAWTRVPYFAATWAVWLSTVVAGAVSARRYRRWWAGTLVGGWSGLVSGLIGLATMPALALVAMPVLLRDPQNLNELSGAGDLSTAIATDFLAAGINHLVIVGMVVGLVLASIGGLAATAAQPTAAAGREMDAIDARNEQVGVEATGSLTGSLASPGKAHDRRQ